MTHYPESTGHDHSPLSPSLAEHVTESQLDANAQNLPILQHEPTQEEARGLDAIRKQLIQVPLIHVASSQHSGSIRSQGIMPLAGRGLDPEAGVVGHTLAVDRSLGLDEYVFMGWGLAGQPSGAGSSYGDAYVLISAETLLDPRTIVTPTDIMEYVPRKADAPFAELSPSIQATLEHQYFNGMLHGSDWLELTARRMFLHLQGNDGQPYPLNFSTGWGEVKFHGTVPPESVIDIVVDDTLQNPMSYDQQRVPRELGRSLIRLGCAIPPYTVDMMYGGSKAEEARKILTPASEVWRRILDAATGPK